ncbi:MAG: monovalent cation/H+ antiporter subunit A [Geminicoccaceae bacterium]|nr:monovalent cation/H+ antiporter subunit A [Geminicoccaceae bacterium]MCX7629503.1 monovalent cation/H+ antiporter subunit A [Geminicoccaceae bacterium]MDW8123619.1 monovalent cation/H+ antiporter subunit A [Geminicoccaceae bacterium]
MDLAAIVLVPLLGAVLPPLLIRSGRDACALVTGAVTAVALALLLVRAPAVFRGELLRESVSWLPQAGLEASFFLDGFGFFFAFLILLVGILIIAYARFYLSREDPLGKFYSFLLLFQGAMVGIVLSDNVLLLVVFWELTSLSSFLLIGYWRHLPEAREGARMALVVTGAGGLALLAGLLLLGEAAGSRELTTILARGEEVRASPLYLPALLLVLLGAFTKSAQFPFHFWLPHAMAAPTPVSAYLHSATMVKAGLFLLGRLWPVLAGTEVWFLLVSGTGLLTMLVAAWIAIFKDDLKALLAFSTVSHLGLVTLLLGLGTGSAVLAGVFHIVNHASFKAALFMTAGIVDHEAGTRDARRLGGLFRLMPITGSLAVLASLSMAGVPPLNGFLSKELLLEETLPVQWWSTGRLFPLLVLAAAACSVAYSLRYAVHVFLGPVRGDYPRHPHDPSPGMWLPAAVLCLPVVAIGLFPDAIAGPLVRVAAEAATAGAAPPTILELWHGPTPALFASLLAFLCGLLLLAAYAPLCRLRERSWRPEAKAMYEAAVAALAAAARRTSDAIHDERLQRTVAWALFAILLVGLATGAGAFAAGTRPPVPVTAPATVLWAAGVACALAVAVLHRQRLLALVVTSVVGLIVSLTFVWFSAPDLALTQLSVEIVTTVLMLLALNYLPRESPRESTPARRARDLAIALGSGLGVGALLYAILTSDFALPTISAYHVAESKPGGGGTNVVNVILVDFRGYDTLGEIIVLAIAALAIFAVLDSTFRGVAAERLRHWEALPRAADRHPMMLVVATRVMLPLALAVGVYIFLRGHNQPGGGFIAGLVVGVALIVQYMASGWAWARARTRIDYHALVGAGVFVAVATGIGSWFFDRPFLTSTYGYLHLPLVGAVELASAALFDLGVFLTVVGVVMLVLANLARVSARIEPRLGPPAPMDSVPRPEPRAAAEAALAAQRAEPES